MVAKEAGEGGPVRGRGGGIVGRERELAALRAWLEAARGGAGRLVLCAGEPGIGKTRLAQELAGVALAGDTAVAWAAAPRPRAPRLLAVAPGAPLARRRPRHRAGRPGRVAEDRFRVFDDLTQAVLAVAARRGGLVVVLDDIHWGDEPSLLVLRHLADQLAAGPRRRPGGPGSAIPAPGDGPAS